MYFCENSRCYVPSIACPVHFSYVHRPPASWKKIHRRLHQTSSAKCEFMQQSHSNADMSNAVHALVLLICQCMKLQCVCTCMTKLSKDSLSCTHTHTASAKHPINCRQNQFIIDTVSLSLCVFVCRQRSLTLCNLHISCKLVI